MDLYPVGERELPLVHPNPVGEHLYPFGNGVTQSFAISGVDRVGGRHPSRSVDTDVEEEHRAVPGLRG